MPADPESTRDAELRRIDYTGVVWFAATAIATAILAGALLIRGWAPSQLPVGAAIVWWAGTGVTVLGLASLAWAGCPILGPDLERADRQKSVCIRVGVVSFLLGAVAAALVVIVA